MAPENFHNAFARARSLLRAALLPMAAAAAALSPASAAAQSSPDTLIVLDASGSMWGQIDGRTKIEIARETLSTVLSEVTSDMNIGMIAYGHRVRGQCSDIETMVPMGPARQNVPRIIDQANRISPRGMTPLTDAVRQAAEEMLYTERAATVVLVTDGIETCDADPCALGRELKAAGIDFTAHVVGFGLTGDEGRQVACLAENTGGRYIPADDSDQLVDALRRTIMADESDFVDEEPAAPARRRVEFTFRDAEGSPKLEQDQVTIVIEPRAGAAFGEWRMWRHERAYSAEGMFEPGTYDFLVTREADRATLRARFEIVIPEGADTLAIERVIASRLKVNTLVNARTRLEHGKGFRSANTSGNGYGVYNLIPVVNGVADEAAKLDWAYRADLDVSIPPGRYILRGTLARSITREKLIDIGPGDFLDYDFDFELARIEVQVRDQDGFPPARPYTRISDEPDGNNFFRSGRDNLNGETLAWYLPVGVWRIDSGQEGDRNRRAQAALTVNGAGEEMVLRLSEGTPLADADRARLADESRIGCLGFGGTEHGRDACIVERVDLSNPSGQQAQPVAIDGLQYPDPGPSSDPTDEMQPSQLQRQGGEASSHGAAFVPVTRWNFASMATMQPIASIVLGDRWDVDPKRAKIALREGWCGQGCPAEIVDAFVPGGTDIGDGSVFFAEAAGRALKFVTGRDGLGGPMSRLHVYEATGDYRSGDASVGEQYVEAIGTMILPATLDGFDGPDFAPRTGSAPRSAASAAPIPPGIYGLIERGGFDLANSADIGEAVAACAQLPFIAYPDGHVQVKEFSAGSAAAGVPYRTIAGGPCSAMDGGARCELSSPDAPGQVQLMELMLSEIRDGHYRLVNLTRGQAEGALYSCVRPGGEMSATETLPDGRKAIDHIMARADGGPELEFADDGRYLGPKQASAAPTAPPAPGGDFSQIAGLYGRLSSSGEPKQGDELLDACMDNALVMYPDGLALGFRGVEQSAGQNVTIPPRPAMHMMCSGSSSGATCAAREGVYPDGQPIADPVQLSSVASDILELCVSGNCFRMQQCRDPRASFAGDFPAPDGRHWLDHVLARPDGGPGVE